MLPNCYECKRPLTEGESAWAYDWKVVEPSGVRAETRYACDGCASPTYGMCTGCGAIEAKLVKASGTRDFSGIGESDRYPTGYGCEFCS